MSRLIAILIVFYIISPIDGMPGPIDDAALLLFLFLRSGSDSSEEY